MSLSRAFTIRTKNQREITPPTSPKRSASKKGKSNSQHVNKLKISAPVQLISTTNMISYTSPSLRTSMNGTTGLQTTGLGLVKEEQDTTNNVNYPPSPASTGSLPPLTPDVGPNLDDVFTPPATPPPNHLSDYFPKRSASQKSNSGVSSHSSTRSSGFENRQIPRIRSISSINSHSSGTPSVIPEESKDFTTTLAEVSIHEAPKRSNSSSSTSTNNPSVPSKSAARVQRSASISSIRSKPRHSKSHSTNPFAQELAQVSELAEDMGLDLDEDCMAKKGLGRFDVDEYMKEIYDVMCFPPTTLKAAVAVGANGWI